MLKSLNRAKKFIIILLLTITGSLLHTIVMADDAVIGRTPAGVYPMMDAVVEMVSEDIVINLDRNIVECTFEFQNTGESRDVLMGFPGKLREDLGSSFSDDASLTLDNLKAFVNGEELPVKREIGIQPKIAMPDYSEWFTFTVPFKEGEKVIVRNTYEYMPTYDSIGDVTTGYVLQTGATWKGKIGKVRVEFKLGSIKPWHVEQLKPGGFRFEGNSIVWERTNIEPAYDLQLTYNTWRYSEEYLAMIEANDEDASDILFKIEKFKEIQKFAKEKDEESLLIEYGMAAESRNSVLASYISGFLPNTQIPDDAPTLGDINIIPYGTAYHISCDVKSLYSPDVVLRIAHEEAGNVVIDSEVKKASTYIILKPEFEYDISISVKDWLNRTATKAVKFKVPVEGSEQEGNSDRAETGEKDLTDENKETGEVGVTDKDETGETDDVADKSTNSDKADGTGTTDKTSGTNGNSDTMSTGVTDETGGTGMESQADGTRARPANDDLQSGDTDIKSADNASNPRNSSQSTDNPSAEKNNRTLLWIIVTVVALGSIAAGFISYIKSKA